MQSAVRRKTDIELNRFGDEFLQSPGGGERAILRIAAFGSVGGRTRRGRCGRFVSLGMQLIEVRDFVRTALDRLNSPESRMANKFRTNRVLFCEKLNRGLEPTVDGSCLKLTR